MKAALPDEGGGSIVGGEAFLEPVQFHTLRRRGVLGYSRCRQDAGGRLAWR
jgi:hypothetical protein